MSETAHAADGPAGLLQAFRRIVESRTSPLVNSARREVFLARPLAVPRLEAVELAPLILDEDDIEVEGSNVPQRVPHKHPLIKIDPPENRIAHREVRARVWSDGLADGFHAGKTVTWSMEPLFVRPAAAGTEPGEPEFRGDWQQAAEAHRDPFEASADFHSEGFTLLDQQRATTTVDATGHTAVRINLPPIAFNAARISAQLEGEGGPIELLDLEVPGVIVIDPGHGGTARMGGSGHNHATSYGDAEGKRTLEKELTLTFGLKLRERLSEMGGDHAGLLRVIMTRITDRNRGIVARANVARDQGADIFISLHFNGNDRTSVRGPETLIEASADGNINLEEDMALAQRVQDAMTRSVPNAQQPGERGYRGIKTYSPPPSGVYRDQHLENRAGQPNSRACLAEIEFITNPQVERDLISGPDAETNQDAVADALANALIDDLMSQP